jgi:hypothetical protein
MGPAFTGVIGDHWAVHMEQIYSLWLTASRLGGGYEGRNFMPAHLKHPSIRPRCFRDGCFCFTRQPWRYALRKGRPF